MERQNNCCRKWAGTVLFVSFLFYSSFICSESITSLSARFLGTPYQIDPLGEGANTRFDQDPLYRFDVFDCQTYVETVLALYLSHDKNSFEQKLLSIRYANEKADYFQRNHFICTDWMPSNIRKKNFHLYQIPGFKYDLISVMIDKKRFYQNHSLSRLNVIGLNEMEKKLRLAELKSHANVVKNQEVTVPYVSLYRIPEIIDKIPEGAIILIIRPERGLLISHMGFAIRKGSILYLRAASSYWGKVIDLPLLEYLNKEARWGRVRGIALLMPE